MVTATEESPLLDVDFNLVTRKGLDNWQRSYFDSDTTAYILPYS